jgi:phage shock protein A
MKADCRAGSVPTKDVKGLPLFFAEARTMSNSPGFFGRLKNAIAGTLNQAVESVSDPGQEVALLLDDLAAQIKSSERDLHQMAVDRKVLEKKRTELAREVVVNVGRAEQALRANNEALARAALELKNKHDLELAAVEASLADQTLIFEKMKADLEAARAKHKSLNLRRGTLMSQARAQKQAERTQGDGVGGGGTLSAIEDKIAQLEARNEVAAELQSERMQDAAVAAQFAVLDSKPGLDDELARLKAKLAGAPALSAGSGAKKDDS